VPKETTFFRRLSNLDSRALEPALLDWLNHLLGPPAAEDDQGSVGGKLVTLDALPTQTQTARIIVQERGADYLMPVKGNPPGVAEMVQGLYERSPRDFMSAKNRRRAFALVTAADPSWLPP